MKVFWNEIVPKLFWNENASKSIIGDGLCNKLHNRKNGKVIKQEPLYVATAKKY